MPSYMPVLLGEVREATQACLQMPSQSSRKSTPEQVQEVVQARAELERKQSLLAQLASEKVQLATNAWEAVCMRCIAEPLCE